MADDINSTEKYKAYNQAASNFTQAFEKFITNLVSKLSGASAKTETFSVEAGPLELKDNTILQYSGKSGITNLDLKYPDGDFISGIIFSTAKSGDIKINFPEGTLFVGRKNLEFFPQETWELSIHNKRVVGVQIFENK